MEQPRVYGLGGYGRGKPINQSSPNSPGNRNDVDEEDEMLVNVEDPRYYYKSRIEIEATKMTSPGLYCSYQKAIQSESKFSNFYGEITYAENPNYFCVRSNGQAKWMDKHVDRLNAKLEADGDDLKLEPIYDYEDTACAVKYERKWHRGYVMSTNFAKHPRTDHEYLAEVNLVDTGYYGYVRLTKLRELPDRWLRHPPMTYRAKLAGDSISARNDDWPKSIVDKFHEMIDNTTLTCEFDTADEEAVELKIRTSDHSCSFCEKREDRCTINEVITRMIDNWKESGRRFGNRRMK